MASRRALISTADLARMASAVAAYGVVLKGRVDPLGNFDFSLTREPDGGMPSNDDLDDRIAKGEGF